MGILSYLTEKCLLMQLNGSRFRNPDLPVSSACDSQSCVRKVSHVKESKWVLQGFNWNWCKALQTGKVMKSSIKVRCKKRCSLIAASLGHKHHTVYLMMWSEVIFMSENVLHPTSALYIAYPANIPRKN